MSGLKKFTIKTIISQQSVPLELLFIFLFDWHNNSTNNTSSYKYLAVMGCHWLFSNWFDLNEIKWNFLQINNRFATLMIIINKLIKNMSKVLTFESEVKGHPHDLYSQLFDHRTFIIELLSYNFYYTTFIIRCNMKQAVLMILILKWYNKLPLYSLKHFMKINASKKFLNFYLWDDS